MSDLVVVSKRVLEESGNTEVVFVNADDLIAEAKRIERAAVAWLREQGNATPLLRAALASLADAIENEEHWA